MTSVHKFKMKNDVTLTQEDGNRFKFSRMGLGSHVDVGARTRLGSNTPRSKIT